MMLDHFYAVKRSHPRAGETGSTIRKARLELYSETFDALNLVGKQNESRKEKQNPERISDYC